MDSFDKLNETMTLLHKLVQSQDEALTIAKDIIDNKTRIIELCEKETNIYKKESKLLFKLCFILFLVVILQSVIMFTKGL